MHYVYFLVMSNSHVYTGSTSNIRRRMYEHEHGKVVTTAKHLPVTLVGYEAYIRKSDALRRERFLKTTEGKRLFRQQYRDILSESE